MPAIVIVHIGILCILEGQKSYVQCFNEIFLAWMQFSCEPLEVKLFSSADYSAINIVLIPLDRRTLLT